MSRYALNLPVQLKQDAEKYATEQGVSLNQFVLWAVAEKVGALKQLLDDPAFPQVTYRRGASGLVQPVVRGTGIHVRTLYTALHYWKMSAAEIAEDYNLSLTQVNEALAFAELHRDEIEASLAADAALEPAHA